MALTDSQNSERVGRPWHAGYAAQVRAWLNDGGDRSIAQKVAGAAFLIRVIECGPDLSLANPACALDGHL